MRQKGNQGEESTSVHVVHEEQKTGEESKVALTSSMSIRIVADGNQVEQLAESLIDS